MDQPAGASPRPGTATLAGDPEPALTPPPDSRPHWIVRIVVGLFLCVHGWAVIGSLARDRPWGQWMRAKTRPYESALDLNQNWSMFAPDAPRHSRWMKVEGVLADGTTIDIQPPIGQPLPGPVEWHYRRVAKLERLGLGKKHSDIRRVLTKTWCKEHRDAGVPLKKVRIHQYWQPLPSMKKRRKGTMPDVKSKLRQELRCRP